MNKVTFALGLIIAGLLGVVGTQYVMSMAPANPVGPDEVQVRTIVSTMLEERVLELSGQIDDLKATTDMLNTEQDLLTQIIPDENSSTVAALDSAQLNPMIEDFLMQNPRVLQRVSEALQIELEREEANSARLALAALETQIYDDPDHMVVGNPNGDVTIVEFYDYNCSFCRQSLPDIARLIEEDSNLRVIFKEFPVLSNDSLEAAKIAVAVGQIPEFDFWAFHEQMFSGRGQVNSTSATNAALLQGLDEDTLRLAANSDTTMAALQRTYALAQQLGISGTPAFIIGDQILPGAMGYDALKQRVDNVRACGSASCE